MKKIKIVAAAICMLSMLALLLVPHGASAQKVQNGRLDAPVAQATPEGSMMESSTPEAGMMEHATPEAAMGTMMEATPEAGMMEQKPGDTMMANGGQGSLPTTGQGDNAWMFWLLGASSILLFSGMAVRKAVRANNK